jgi:hypothetical protein
MKFYAHTADDGGQWQPLATHLQNVAELPDGSRDPEEGHWQLLKGHLSRVAALAAQFAHLYGLKAGDSPSAIHDPTRFQEAGQRADRVKKHETALFNYFAPEARVMLNELLEEYATDGEAAPLLLEQMESPMRPAAAINASRFPSPTYMLPPCLLH